MFFEGLNHKRVQGKPEEKVTNYEGMSNLYFHFRAEIIPKHELTGKIV